MIAVLLRDLRWRLLGVVAIALVMYSLEPAFHQHDAPVEAELAPQLAPIGISATLAYLAGLSMIVLLAGFVSTDRREGYARLFLSHPTSPLALYGLRWALALVLSLAAAALFLLVGQIVAWGEFAGGAGGMLMALLAALVYGGLMAILSVLLPRGDAWVALLLFLPTFFPQILTLLEQSAGAAFRLVLFLLPPQTALTDVYQGLIQGDLAWGAVAFVVGYAAVLLTAAGLVLRLREWP